MKTTRKIWWGLDLHGLVYGRLGEIILQHFGGAFDSADAWLRREYAWMCMKSRDCEARQIASIATHQVSFTSVEFVPTKRLLIAGAIALAFALMLFLFEAALDRAARGASGAADLGLHNGAFNKISELVNAGISVATLRAVFITGDEYEPIGG